MKSNSLLEYYLIVTVTILVCAFIKPPMWVPIVLIILLLIPLVILVLGLSVILLYAKYIGEDVATEITDNDSEKDESKLQVNVEHYKGENVDTLQ